MCGIFFKVSGQLPIGSDVSFKDFIAKRGQDSLKEFHFTYNNTHHITGISSVLHLRGATTTVQPLVSDEHVLQWNGEIFAFDSPEEIVDHHLLSLNDTQFLFNLLPKRRLADILVRIDGPWAVALFDRREGTIYFGRDCFGRRSLLFSKTEAGMRIASLASERQESWQEAQSGYLYQYDMQTGELISIRLPFPEIKVNPRTSSELNCDLDRAVTDFHSYMSASVERRTYAVSDSLAILFSGGVDSVLIAALTAEILSKKSPNTRLDLVNVAFENESFKKSLKTGANYFDHVPDRSAGLLAYSELQRLFSNLTINFLPINVRKKQYEEACPRVLHLLYPNRTVMDLSIGIGLWFAAGYEPTRSKVLLVGMGADEQLGGYSRHRTAFANGSWQSLAAEMQLDVDRIGSRNLGRDDRCISDHGREARFPFLDESLVKFVASLPINFKYDGGEDKILIRQLVKRFGFTEAVYLRPKKALQFGAKTAKMADSRLKGDDLL